MRFSYTLHYTRGYGFDHWVFEPSFLSFPSHITLAYVTSRVLRPLWGHEIRRYLWQSLLGLTFVDWLKYSRYYVSLMGNTFGSIWFLSLAWHIDVWWIFEFRDSPLMISDSSFCCASDIHTRAYFPFILRSLVMVGLYGYPWSWLLRCSIDVKRWLINVDRCLVGYVIFFVVY